MRCVGAELSMSGCNLAGNDGAIDTDSNSVVELRTTQIYENHSNSRVEVGEAIMSVRNGSTLIANLLQVFRNNGSPLLLIENADTVRVANSKFWDNKASFGVIKIYNTGCVFLNCTFRDNWADDGNLFYVDRGSNVQFEGAEFCNNRAYLNQALMTFRPGSYVKLKHCTFTGNLAGTGEDNRTEEQHYSIIENYGILRGSYLSFAYSWPNHILFTGQPPMTPGQVMHWDEIDTSGTILLVSSDSIAASDTASASFHHICIFECAEPDFLVYNSSYRPDNTPHLAVRDTDCKACIHDNPKFLNPATCDLRFRPDSPCILPADPYRRTSDPDRLIMGSGGVFDDR